ncbi:very short patch repair endonuclease [Sphingomonas kyeonggiensis]|uniref:very short patch repair endonuclease n=1 Tax=Sphingomonas kyeonggiensis TaxID=1268553 RepID=UPI0016194E9F|nr:very short patch repair endonuclease [Sphingomonas kyeonggiensis]
MDRISSEKRSANMRAVRNRDTKPEIRVRSILHRAGYRFRLHRRDLPGSPDIVLPRYGTAIFVHGCFWHGHEGCRRSKLPSTRTDFWQSKIGRNKERDETARAALIERGYRVVTLWECELNSAAFILEHVNDVTGRGERSDGEATTAE